MKKKLSVFLCAILIFALSANVFAVDNDKVNSILKDTADYVYNTVQNPQVGSIGGEWAVLGLAGSGIEIPENYYRKYYDNLTDYVQKKQGVLHDVKYTEYSRVVLALGAIGKDPYDVGGYNLITPLYDYIKVAAQGINGSIWALIALSGCDDNKDILSVKEIYKNNILESQTSDGGWAMSGDEADADVTAMAMQALAKYRDDERVSKALEKALSCMSKKQLSSGGFSSRASGNGENAESCAQMIIALCELGISLDDARFVKDGNTMLDNLFMYYVNGKGFKHIINSDVNQMATEQSLIALSAVKRFTDGKSGIYNINDNKIIWDNNNTPIGMTDKNPDVIKTDIIFPGKTFDDIKTHKSKNAVEEMASRGIINGKSDDLFEPDSTMTRAEFAAVVVRGLGLKDRGNTVFYDFLPSDWFFKYVNTAYSYGIVNGVSETEFNPYGTITREEAAVMTARAAKLCGMNTDKDASQARDILAGFTDYVTVSSWAVSSLAFCYDSGILSQDDMEINPNWAVTRGEIADMLYNMLKASKLL